MSAFIESIKKNKNDIILPVTVLLAICIVIPLALSLTNKVTVDKIAELEEENQRQTMSRLIKADKFENKSCASGDFDYFVAKSGNKIEGYIFITSAKGYGGDDSVMTAVNTDGTVKSVAILDVSNETPGLGQNAAKENFYSQYKDKKSGISLVKNGAVSEKNEVNAVTGATITSKAVTSAVNKALDNYNLISGDGNKSDKGGAADEK